MCSMWVDVPQVGLSAFGAGAVRIGGPVFSDQELELQQCIDEALNKLPLHLERAVRDAFQLRQNLRLEDVQSGSVDEALRLLATPDIGDSLREFLNY